MTENSFDKIERALKKALDEIPAENKPDAFLFLEWGIDDRDYDIPQRVWGLRVYFHSRLTNDTARMEPNPVPWVPLWLDQKREPSQEYLEYFNETYLEYAEMETHE